MTTDHHATETIATESLGATVKIEMPKAPKDDDPAAVEEIVTYFEQRVQELSDDLQNHLSMYGEAAPVSADHGYALDGRITNALQDWLLMWPE